MVRHSISLSASTPFPIGSNLAASLLAGFLAIGFSDCPSSSAMAGKTASAYGPSSGPCINAAAG